MTDSSFDKDELIRQLMADRDRLFRENSRLRSTNTSSSESEKQDYKKQLEQKQDLLEKQEVRIAQLEKQVAYLNRILHGGKAERYINPNPDARQLDIFEGVDLLPDEKEAAIIAQEEISTEKEKRTKRMEKAKNTPIRKSLPENLERREEHIYPDGYNIQEWTLLDEEEPLYTEILMKEPTKFYVLRTYRHKAIRKSDRLIVTASCPIKPLAKSYASSSLLADLMVDKYVDHIPFYRQRKQFERLGINIPESTILGWFQQVSDLLMPLHFRLWELMKKSDYLQCDETTLPVVRDKHKTVKGYLWLVRDPMSKRQYFYWDKGSRSGEVVLKLFNGYQGALQTDGYERYELLEGKKGVILLSCWAHARRKFTEAIKNDKERSENALEQIQLLYEVECQIKDEELSYEKAAELRKRLAYPIMVRFEKWLVAEYPKVLKGSPIEKAILYTYKRFNKLSRYHLDGRYSIDNNGIENAVRPVAIGRKNYLFCQNDDSAESTAIIYSLMGCCKASGVNFRDWMMYFLDHVHDYDQDYSRDIAELLPDNLKKTGIL